MTMYSTDVTEATWHNCSASFKESHKRYIYRASETSENRSNLPSRVVTHASMASKVTRLKMSDVEADGTGRQTMCLSHLLSLCFPLSSVCMAPRRQGQMVTVTVPVLVRPEAPSRSTTGTYRVSKDEEKPGRGSKADWSTRLAVTPDNTAKKNTHQTRSVHNRTAPVLAGAMFLDWTWIKVLMGLTSSFPDGEVERRAGLWRDAEVDRGVLSSLILVDGPQDLNYL